MSYKIALSQSGYPADGDVVAQARRAMERAGREGCQLVVFPENFMWPRKLLPAEIIGLAEPVDGPFVQAMGSAAHECGLWAVFVMNESGSEGGLPFNTAVVVDDAGQVRGSYRKCHLYDALGQRESDRLTPGSSMPEPVRAPFATIGLQVCYDLRFPEPARALALAGCDLIVYPAAWHDGPRKPEQWETLLKARAVENELFVAGICRAGEGFSGRSMVADPMGRVLACGAPGGSDDVPDELVTCEVGGALVRSTRENMPVFEHRRPELYGTLAR